MAGACASWVAYTVAGGTAALDSVLTARGLAVRAPRFLDLADGQRGTLSLVLVAALVVVVILLSILTASAAWLAGAVMLAFLPFAAQYVLPCYVAWGLPALGLVWRSRLVFLVAVQAASARTPRARTCSWNRRVSRGSPTRRGCPPAPSWRKTPSCSSSLPRDILDRIERGSMLSSARG